MKVKIDSYHPILLSSKLQFMSIVFDFSIVNYGTRFYTVNDGKGLTFGSFSDAENYCQNQEYEIEETI